ncbi:hypothetical protein ACWGCW_26935 [Streptomyces sp. NPDC054933]
MRSGRRAHCSWTVPGLTVVGQVADGLSAIERVCDSAPDVVRMELNVPRCDGIETTTRADIERAVTAPPRARPSSTPACDEGSPRRPPPPRPRPRPNPQSRQAT